MTNARCDQNIYNNNTPYIGDYVNWSQSQDYELRIDVQILYYVSQTWLACHLAAPLILPSTQYQKAG